MSTALNSTIDAFAPGSLPASREAKPRSVPTKGVDYSQKLKQHLLLENRIAKTSKRDFIILGLLVIVGHALLAYGYSRYEGSPVLPESKKNEVVIEFIKPEPPPPPPPPKIEPPKPKVEKVVPPAPKPVPVLKTRPADIEEVITPQDIVIQENTDVEPVKGPVVAEPSPPPPPKEEPVTEAIGYAGYLKNPAPEYPAFAQRQGWEGKVILRVRVLANGKAGSVEVRQSSGRKTLDEAALEVVRYWTFIPSKRGDTPIDGWATVPIEFRLSK